MTTRTARTRTSWSITWRAEHERAVGDDAGVNQFVFDPRVFIRPPYIQCPSCGVDEQFGVLMIGAGYTRRCRQCWHTESFDLPEIRKTVIYLDQMAISEMMKVLN